MLRRSALALFVLLLFAVPLRASASSGADLAVRVTATPNPIDVGQRLTYTIVVRNKGPLDATDVVLTSSPDKVVLDSIDPSQGTCNENGTSCTLGPIVSGSIAVVTIVVVPLVAGVLHDPLAVKGAEPDPRNSNNLVLASTTVKPARIDLSSGIDAASETVTTLSDLVLTATVSNGGPDPATDVKALLDVHHKSDNGVDLLFRSVSASTGSCTSDGPVLSSEIQIECDVGLLSPGEAATITIDAVPLTPGDIASTVNAVASSSLGKGNERDVDMRNNTARTESQACLPIGCS